jgi:hypothetical protein
MWQELRGYGFRRRCLGGVTGVRCWQVGVVERRSEEQSLRLEACPAACLRQSVGPHLRRPHPLHQHWPDRRRGLGGGCVSAGCVVAHGGEDDVGQSPFQAAEGFAFRFAGGAFAFVVGATFGVAADLGERDGVEGPVELAVPAGIEPVPETGNGAVPFADANAFRFG